MKLLKIIRLFLKNVGSAEDCYFTAIYASYCKKVSFAYNILYNWVVRKESVSGSKKIVTSNNDTTMLNRFLTNVKPICEKIKDNQNDLVVLEYQIIKVYCVAIYHNYRYASISEKIKSYYDMHNMMLDFNDNYYKNPLIKLSYPTPIRSYAKKIIWLTIILERLHLMPVALIGYHIISKFHYFNI